MQRGGRAVILSDSELIGSGAELLAELVRGVAVVPGDETGGAVHEVGVLTELGAIEPDNDGLKGDRLAARVGVGHGKPPR
jgi:hypothetical protein